MDRQAAINSWSNRLANNLPGNTAATIATWIVDLKVRFVVSKPRSTKLGDFRANRKGPHQITINSDLNRYSFLVTTIHEFAHLGCYLKHGNKVKPHGKEWKDLYARMLGKFLDRGVFPSDLSTAIKKHLKNPKASSCSCPELSAALSKYDTYPGPRLVNLAEGDLFIFRKEEYKIVEFKRTRVLCCRTSDKRKYLISGRAKIQLSPSR